MNRDLSSKEERALTQQAFDRLLACFDSDRERAGEKYENLHCKLVKFFEWRACAVAASTGPPSTRSRRSAISVRESGCNSTRSQRSEKGSIWKQENNKCWEGCLPVTSLVTDDNQAMRDILTSS